MTLALLITVILVALIFEYINGFHDTANVIATVVSTKVLTPRVAVVYGAFFNFIGAFAGTHVAKTIGAGIIDGSGITQIVILSALLGAIIWNIITWYFGLPSSSSHALIGSLVGASICNKGTESVQFGGVLHKVIIPMVTSPVFGLMAGFVIMISLMNIFHRTNPDRINKYFSKLQILSAGIMAFSHGSNDAQKTMGIITLALISFGGLHEFAVPFWVVFACGITMGAGTMGGGWRIIRTMGNKIMKLRPIHGFAVEITASGVILLASHFGIPLSTTHVKTASILGVGSTMGFSAVKWGIVGNIIWAWILTIPICALLSALCFQVIKHICW